MKRVFALFCCMLWCFAALSSGCDRGETLQEPAVTVTFKHGKIAGGAECLQSLIREFQRQNPDIIINDEALPSSTDEQHQFYVINLEGASQKVDVLSMDVIWVAEFARAGWLAEVSDLLPEEKRKEFFQGPIDAVTFNGRVYAIPWYIDAGVLYYRKDLLRKYGFTPPKTWHELVRTASAITSREPDLYGFLWQGKQYEGLVCNVLEYLWSNGGGVIKDGKIVIDNPENRFALAFMGDLIYTYKVSPEFVTTSTEETTRHIFGKGKALFMRNWPYAWNLFERDTSPVKGKTGVLMLPCFQGHSAASTLGGWQLGINKNSPYIREAKKFIRFLASCKAQKILSLKAGYKPTLKKLYNDKDLIKSQPFITLLYEIFEHAKPRPVTPYYMMLSHILQSECSAVLAHIKGPAEALQCAQAQMKFILRKHN